MRRTLATAVCLSLLPPLLAACSGSSAGPAAGPPASATTAASSPASPTAAPAVSPSSTAPGTPANVTQYHRDDARTGDDPTAAPTSGPLRVAWRLALDGAVYAQPLLIGGTLVVATERNSVYGVRDGHVVWHTKVGGPVALSDLPCGNIDPIGITGTPVYDPATRTVFAVAELDRPVRHVLVAVDPATGAVRWRRDVNPRGMVARAQQQRAALALSRDQVWVAFGGLYGDCGQYRGWVVGARTDGAGPLVDYVVPTRREGGIWAPSGPAVTAGGDLLVAVGNGAAGAGDAYDRTDSVLRLSGTTLADWFAPSSWARENDADLDLGSMGPVLVDGGRWVVQGGKAGDVYLLDPAHLGGFDGQRDRVSGCAAYGGAASRGTLVLLPCHDGLTAYDVRGGRLQRRWQAATTGSPVIGGQNVYVTDRGAGRLHRLDLRTGRATGSVAVGDLSRFATPVTAGAMVFVPTLAGVTAVQLTP